MKLPRAVAIPKFMHDRDRMERALVQLTAFCRTGPQCFLHGDYHLGNLYFDADGRAGTLDWQSGRRGHWSHDVTYFLVSALDIADRRRWDRALLQHYLGRLEAHGVTQPPTFDTAWEAFRLQIIDGLYFWLVNPVEFQAEENNCAVAPRFAMAALDHDTFSMIT
jgi:aminoglycoside phosphotransferase (APT) family kinase protein